MLPGKKENMRKQNPFPPLAKSYYALLAAADEKEGAKSVVMIAPLLDELTPVLLPKAIHTLCWSIAEHSQDESIEALVLAMRARYHPELSMDHVYPLLYEIDDEMLRTAKDAGVSLIISEDGLLNSLVNDYPVYYRDSEWRIELSDEDVGLETLAEVIKYTGKLRRAEKRRNRGKH